MRYSFLLVLAALLTLNGCSQTQSAPPLSRSQPLDVTGTETYQQEYAETYNPTIPAAEPVQQIVVDQPVIGSTNQDALLIPANEPLRMAYEAQRAGAYPEMIDRFKQAASLGSVHAHYELARFYLQGKYVGKNPELAVSHLQDADALGYGQATRVLAWLYLKGEAVQKDVSYGAQLMERATVNSVRAQREAGLLFSNVYQPHLNDAAKGRMYLEQAYLGGDGEAAFYYHQILAKEGSEQASQEALKYSAAQGYAKALKASSGAPTASLDPESGADTVKLAALRGDTDAMYRYANNVLLGRYPSIDKDVEAYAWFSIAAERNEPRSAQELPALEGVKTLMDRRQPGYVANYIDDIRSAITD